MARTHSRSGKATKGHTGHSHHHGPGGHSSTKVGTSHFGQIVGLAHRSHPATAATAATAGAPRRHAAESQAAPSQETTELAAAAKTAADRANVSAKMSQAVQKLAANSQMPQPVADEMAKKAKEDAENAARLQKAANASRLKQVSKFKFPLNTQPFSRGGSTLSDSEAERIFKKEKSWNNIKKKYASDPNTMAGLFAWRKKYVDGLIDKARAKYPMLIANASGSNDLTSDYDVTVTVVGDPKQSVQVIEEINEQMRRDFGKESGTVFDTNLYYKAVKMKDNILKDSNVSQEEKQKIAELISQLEEPEATRPVTPDSLYDYHRDQDILALLKQRRYMSDEEWNAYKADTLALVAPVKLDSSSLTPEQRALYQEMVANTAARFKEAELLYVQFSRESKKMLQKLTPQFRDELAHMDPDDLQLKVNNLLYIEKLKKVAEAEEKEASLLAILNDAEKSAEDKAQAWEDLNETRRQIYRLKGESLYFAAEAYHSTGALVHIVEGLQGGGRINAPLELLLQSFNEQHGDFMKDAGHYTDDGEFFYRSAKYAGRMSVAMRDYFLKANNLTLQQLTDAGLTLDDVLSGTEHLGEARSQELADAGIRVPFTFTAEQKQAYQTLDRMANDPTRNLLAMRKGVSKSSGDDAKDWYTDLTPEQKQLWASRYAEMFAGASNKKELVGKLMDLAAEFNGSARLFNALTFLQRNGEPLDMKPFLKDPHKHISTPGRAFTAAPRGF